jgi:hypothetical protein
MIEQPGEFEATVLRQAMFDAFEHLQAAHASYKNALAIAVDTDLSSDGMLAIRQQGRAYAGAVRKYSDAVMAWLIVVETHSKNARELLPKMTASGESTS